MNKIKINFRKLGQAIVWFCLFLSMVFVDYGEDIDTIKAIFFLVITIVFAYLFQECLGDAIK